jgi:SAM-dependent methyltransferase
MHNNNMTWLRETKQRHPEAFTGSILEVGSNEPDGITRSYFQLQFDPAGPLEGCKSYVGIDQAPGVGVDIVSNLMDYDFRGEKFDTVVMLSVFEHDPKWRDTLRIGIDLLKTDGYMIIGFGPEGNPRHDPEPWRPVPHKDFLMELCRHDVAILEAIFEEQRYGHEIGCFDVVIRKSLPRPDAWAAAPWYSPGRYVWQQGF